MPHETRLPECLELQAQFKEHIHESICVRDRLKTAELSIEQLQKDVKAFDRAVMKHAIIGGIIGALIGSNATPAIVAFINFLMKG